MKSAVRDLQTQLKKVTGEVFKDEATENFTNEGIQIILSKGKNADTHLNLSDDAFRLFSDGKNFLKIIANTPHGLSNGIYTYLDTLGFRWLAPGEEWEKIPQLKSISIQLNKIVKPDFLLRAFSGTYGTPRNGIIDKTKSNEKAWQLWETRNRMGGEYELKGHSWNDFIWHRGWIFNKHPEYTALINGERTGLHTSAKLCISNPEVQKLFVEYKREQLDSAIKRFPNKIRYILSVEPSDGGGQCQCNACEKMGNISDRVFFLANLVAREFQKISQKAYVNLYAYNEHAQPPKQNLELNVIVQLVPYKYQDYAAPEKMVEDWKGKCEALFVYDYYGLPIKNLDMPMHGYLKPEEYSKRINEWKEKGLKGFTLESSYSIGATGEGLYLASRLGWRTNESTDEILRAYYLNAFGKGGEAVRNAQQILRNATQDKNGALETAAKIIKDKTENIYLEANEKKCLTDFKMYLLYIKFFYHFQQKKSKENAEALLKLVYGNFFRNMVHPLAVLEYLSREGNVGTYIEQNWNKKNMKEKGRGFLSVTQMSDEQVEAEFINAFK